MMEFLETFWLTYNTLIYTIGIQMIVALSLYLTLSCGLLSLGNSAFMGIGAYVASICTMNFALPFWSSLGIGMIIPAIVALIIGIPVLRLSGVYLAMATLGFGEVVRVTFLNLEITGGPMGLNGIPQLTTGLDILIALSLVIYLLVSIKFSKLGRAFEAIKEDEIAAGLMGINVAHHKLFAFVLGGMIAGLAGGLNAHLTFFISPREYGFDQAVDYLTMVVLGGMNSLIGPMIGSFILTILPEALRFLHDFRMGVNGIILILVTLYLPNGIWQSYYSYLILSQFKAKKSTIA